ncbi:UNVERIFIED_CONTAM: hypothetical protein GTU68_060746 [Idotea baltica]|nr:hypothetical protein [Idotea baltica]
MSVNKVILLGRLGADPELRYSQNQTAICNLSVATSERRKGADGQWAESTEWHRIITFGKTAENCSNYLAKGRQVFIDGRIQTRKWQDKQGQDRYTTEIVANNVQFIGGKGDSAGGQSQGGGYSQQQAAPAQKKANGGEIDMSSIGEPVSFDDDDIPF